MKTRIVGFASLLLVAGLASIASGHGEPAFTDPAKAGPDFAVQGEYVGKMKVAGEEKPVGVQVMALGKHEFQATLFHGGLPGDGWKHGDKEDKAKGQTEGDKTELTGSAWKAKIQGDTMTISDTSGDTLGELKKIERKSPTLGAAAPAGAIVLFDGKNTAAWHHGKIVEGDLLGIGPTSKQSFKDFTLHVEFRCPFMPDARGQARGNSGVYLQDRYEVQVLDSFGAVGDGGDCGALYSIAPESINMSFPPLSWQTYDIDFTAARCDEHGKKTADARVTVKHNGVVVHDNLQIPHNTPGQIGNETPAKGDTVVSGPIYLQDHGGDPEAFRNIWVVEKK
ncbi:MAG TPA: DUF1080 domain-containing protein [Pirellulales bacterium]|jgi:hypothetical protein|nr:DUF1080 domain-containing protein [Pirellulales bacterium]